MRGRKMQLSILVYLLLFVPTISLIAQNIPAGAVIPGILVSIGLSVVIFILTTFFTTKGLRIFYSALLAVTLIPGAVLLGYLLFANVLLSDGSLMTLFETNANESKEFIIYYMNPWVTLGIALYILTPILFIFKMKNIACHSIKEHKKTFGLCILLLFLFLAVEPVAQHIYFVDFYRVFAEYKIRTAWEEKAIESRQAHDFEVVLSEKYAPQTLVVVIGESLTRHHMSLYGYERNTNPRLSARKSSLKVYQDVIAPHVHTIPALRSILTFADEKHPEYLTARPSLFELFNRARYETYLISNQPFEEGSSSYEPLLRLADHTIDVSKTDKPDGVLLPEFERALENPARKLIVVHLIGCHAVYKFRYPDSYNHFDHCKQPLTAHARSQHANVNMKDAIDQYDNAVLYNDFLIETMIGLMERKNESSAMIYFSDHGEEIFDFRDFAGHAYEKTSTYMCDVPFIVWTSGRFDQIRNDLIYDEERPFSTIDLLYALSDVAGLRFEGYEARRSIFSSQFASRERRVGELTYTHVRTKTDEEIAKELVLR